MGNLNCKLNVMLFLFIFIYLNFNLIEKVGFDEKIPVNDTISIYGNCFDINTGVNLIVKGKVLIDSGNSILISSDKLGTLDFQIPMPATAIVFESFGYRREVIPIHTIAANPGIDHKFLISIPMSKIDSMPVYQKNLLSLFFLVVDNIEVNYEISLKSNRENLYNFTYDPRYTPKNIVLDMHDKLGTYLITATLNSGEILFTEEIVISEGINFKSLVVKKNTLNTGKEEEKIGIDNKNKFLIMFSQSDYALSESSKVSLNIVASLLLKDSELVLKIIGHTDNVGKEKLNMTLSEYRARVTAQYLIKKGVPVNQIEYEWKGSSSPLFPNDTEANKKGNRRVELTITKR